MRPCRSLPMWSAPPLLLSVLTSHHSSHSVHSSHTSLSAVSWTHQAYSYFEHFAWVVPLFLECSSPRHLHGSFSPILPISAQMLSSPQGLSWSPAQILTGSPPDNFKFLLSCSLLLSFLNTHPHPTHHTLTYILYLLLVGRLLLLEHKLHKDKDLFLLLFISLSPKPRTTLGTQFSSV